MQQVPVRVQAGFTLLEVMIVITILGVLTASAVPAFQEWRQTSAVNSATMALFAKFKQARSLAVAESRKIIVALDEVNNIVIYDDNDGGACINCKPQSIPLNQFSDNLNLKANTNFTFNRLGTATNATIKLEVGEYYKCITVNGIGRARIIGVQGVAAAGAEETCRVM